MSVEQSVMAPNGLHGEIAGEAGSSAAGRWAIASSPWNGARTPLGLLDSWPQSLRATVSLCLASNFPISLAWGPHHVQIYNDGYWPICGAKHPHSWVRTSVSAGLPRGR